MLKQNKYQQTMKTKLIAMALIATMGMSFKGIQEKNSFKFGPQDAKITWLAKKVTGKHNGSINLKDGTLNVNKGKLEGTFLIDMTSIQNEDLTDPGYNAKLVGHLKSEDFFNVEKFPVATLKLKDSKLLDKSKGKYELKADLTIKGITKEVVFPAVVLINGKIVSAVADIQIDRSKYDVRYGSKSFFENLGDKVIDDIFEIHVQLGSSSI